MMTPTWGDFTRKPSDNTFYRISIKGFLARSQGECVYFLKIFFLGKICFVSGSKDHNIRVWEINSEKCDAVYNLPKRNFGKKRDMTRSSCFPAVLWINEKVIACGLQRLRFSYLLLVKVVNNYFNRFYIPFM